MRNRFDFVPGQQHQQFRALGLGQRPYLGGPDSFRSHLHELESYRRTKHHHHHHPASAPIQNPVGINNSNSCGNPSNSSTTSPSSGSHLANTGGPSAHQDCYKHSPQHGGMF
jgi:hypothetical protein